MGVFFDVSPWFSDTFLFGIDLDKVTEVSKETDENYTHIFMSYVTLPYIDRSWVSHSISVD